MKKHALYFVLVLISATLVLCTDVMGGTPAKAKAKADAKVKKLKKCVFPKSRKRAPAWICDAHADGLAIAATGSAAKSAAGHSFMEQQAAADARARLAASMHEPTQNKNKDGELAANPNTTATEGTPPTAISNETLIGAKVLKSVYGPNGTLYVLVGLDEAGLPKRK